MLNNPHATIPIRACNIAGYQPPINDLSRGCNADEVYKMAIITAGMK